MYWTYVLRSTKSGRFYVGSTGNLPQRLAQHNAGMTPSTRAARPWELVYREESPSRSDAIARERAIKAWKNPEYMKVTLGIA